jgi:leader peptidase (prepilin peptidase)/N-methyltransferase
MPGAFDAFWAVVAFAFGAVVGSFLNVVIWRVPRGESVVSPGSHCPHCNRGLVWWENVPLVSFLALRARCRTCGGKIRWRYFWVELATAVVFAGLVKLFGATADGIAYCLFAAALMAALGIDLEHYIIPDSINTFALLVGVGRDVWGIASGEAGHALMFGWLPRSVAGAVICAAVFVVIQAMGLALFRKDAMGDGDVKLARAVGAMLPLALALVSFLFAVGVGAIIGGAMVVSRGMRERSGADGQIGRPETDGGSEPFSTPWGLFGVSAVLYVTFGDLVVDAASRAKAGWAVAFNRWWNDQLPPEEDADFVPAPTQVPFGPFMVIGAMLALVVGRQTIAWYMQWSGLGTAP